MLLKFVILKNLKDLKKKIRKFKKLILNLFAGPKSV